ncbi:endoglucanase 17-like, partial [Trifolium medium]|nr:endoglucanase 17-like [Trifolium medium]
VNLVGGYYDAGDNVKFGWPMSFTVSLLSWAAVEYKSEISSVGDGNKDHQCWERPEDMDTPRTLYKVDANSPGTEAAADSAAALSAASIVFKKKDTKYSSKLLSQSKSVRNSSSLVYIHS